VDRLACTDVPALALQLLLRAHPDWRAEPSVVVERNAPQGAILWANQNALRSGVRPGLCYSAGLALCARLRAAEVSAEEIVAAVGELTEVLHASSPHVEPCAEEPGVFWLDASGLARLEPSLTTWAETLLASLRAAGFAGSVAVGFRRFGSYAAAKSLTTSRAIVFDGAADEEAVARGAPLTAIALPIAALEELHKLGVRTVHELARLPAGAVLQRFGAEVHRLHRLAAGELESALDPTPHELPLTAGVDLDYDATDLAQILELAMELAQPLLTVLERSARAIAELRLTLQLSNAAATLEETLAPAAPTRDLAWLARLLRLRLEGASLGGGVSRVQVTLRGGSSSSDQLALFNVRHGRDPAAAERAFAALRAAFGDDSVVRARPKAAHLPEASFAWERLERLAPPRPRAVASAPLVRRILSTPRMLPPRAPRESHEQGGWMPCGLEHGRVVRLDGPYSLCGGWWREEVRRDYHFAELQSGELLWLYYDRKRRRWFLHGSVS
jgi:protein ImuB